MRDVGDVRSPDIGECAAHKHIAAATRDSEHAIGAAGATGGSAAHGVPVRAVPTRDAVGQRFARGSEKPADIYAVVSLADAGYVDGGSRESIGRLFAQRIIIESIITHHMVHDHVSGLVEIPADVKKTVLDQHTIGHVVQRILKNPVRSWPRRPAKAVPFGKDARVYAAHI